MTILDPLTALEREQLRYIVERVQEWPDLLSGADVFYYKKGDLDMAVTRAQYDAMKAELSAPVRKTGREGDACPCSGSANWNIPAWKIPICDNPEYGEDGLCNNCDHEKACHDVGFAPAIDYRAHCEELAEAVRELLELRDLTMNSLVNPLRREDVVVHDARQALTRWAEEGK